ncbi:hypothetical protein [Ralstonia phage phiRSL1]|uniref:Uncharacterized protein n=1 Tax=Ralstonia phage phiRSL1 TaxID=1980924 RepID=B2ZY25_9CAUD|nr:hypothetical protein RSL1_ORF123 [Ralstonia phage phiRSL1]BAG41568.1 hypothetical protein [Ralstonia phage phiRSL1]
MTYNISAATKRLQGSLEVNANKLKTAKDVHRALSFYPGVVKDKGIMAELAEKGDAPAPKDAFVEVRGSHIVPKHLEHMHDLGIEIVSIEVLGSAHYELQVKFH